MREVVVDIETTGLDHKKGDKIIDLLSDREAVIFCLGKDNEVFVGWLFSMDCL